jgi:glutaredoxin 3
MPEKRQVEVFTAGCPVCEQTVEMVRGIACESCDVTVVDVRDPVVARRVETLGIRSVPAVAVNGTLADCCRGGPSEADLRRAGIGQPV